MNTNTNVIDDITNDISKVTVSAGNVICGSCTDTSSEQKILEHTKSDKISADAFDCSSTVSNTNKDICGTDAEICANCGKEGASNTCNKCKQVKYCNAACKKRHRSKHKKECEEHLRRAAELLKEEIRRAAELHDLELFKTPPQQEEECPICFLLLPNLVSGSRYQSCCGKTICCGCIHAMETICPFCRTPTPDTDEESRERLQGRMKVNDDEAIHIIAGYYSIGLCGLAQNYTKALELWQQAAELGHVKAYYNIGCVYQRGNGVSRDMIEAVYYWGLGAIKGDADARYNLGICESKQGNPERAIKHYIIAVEGGDNASLKKIQYFYSNGYATKDVYTKALRVYQTYLDKVKSNQRDEAAAAREDCSYIE